MSKIALKRITKLSRKKAEQFVLDLANYSNHYNFSYHFTTLHELKKYCSSVNISLEAIVEQARDIKQSVPHFENLVGSLWTATGMRVQKINPESGAYETVLDGDGQWSEAPYWTNFDISYKLFESSVESSSFPEFFGAVERGFSSIEHYIDHRVRIWNGQNPTQKLIDNSKSKVRFEEKIGAWIPLMSGGVCVDKGSEIWQSFKFMKELRDGSIVHSSRPMYGLQYKELARLMGHYGPGIAGMLFHLHVIFGERVPAIVIRAHHTSKVIIIS